KVLLHVTNKGTSGSEGDLAIVAPTGWLVEPAREQIKVAAATAADIEVRVIPPADRLSDAELTAIFACGGANLETKTKAHPLPVSWASRFSAPPALDGTDSGWEKVPLLGIPSTNLVEGKVADEADSSALFRVAHDGKMLFVDVQVKDDAIITN